MSQQESEAIARQAGIVTALRTVAEVAGAHRDAKAALVGALRVAQEAGATLNDLSEVSGIPRSSVQRWIALTGTGLPSKREWPGILDEALAALIELGGPQDAISTGMATTKLDAKARRFQLAVKQITQSPPPDSEAAEVIGLANQIAQHAIHGGTKPRGRSSASINGETDE